MKIFKISYFIIFCAFCTLLINCKKVKNTSTENAVPFNHIATDEEYDSLYVDALNGNCDAFFELYIDMMEFQDKSEILKLSKNTFEKDNNCGPAVDAYFDALCRKNGIRDYGDIIGRDLHKMIRSDYLEAKKCLGSMLKNGNIQRVEYDNIVEKYNQKF